MSATSGQAWKDFSAKRFSHFTCVDGVFGYISLRAILILAAISMIFLALIPFAPLEYCLAGLAPCLIGIVGEILNFKRGKSGRDF